MSAIKLVLAKLKGAKNKGIMLSDFPIGFRLSARIGDLRGSGVDILTLMEEDFSQGYKRRVARYIIKNGVNKCQEV